ncbi:hypothetical protein PVAND_002726 [Polypedilum vanderplanki]|uniref:UDP-glucuronosyltransferase n=1 Tax=Polypedilum vanderplanki TaxID=319348 RepID=A0A9J6BT05_POLVA|nr:hypothetical protein PVAND_002726 [Polypedilum vanderplanki]
MFLLIFLFLNGVVISSSSNILAVFPMHYKSHFMIGSAVVRELANKGHNVTLISPYELKHPNVNSVILTNKPKVIMNEFLLADISIITNFIVVPKISEYAINFSLSHENVVPLFKEKFDAVIVEIFMTEALYGKSFFLYFIINI